MNKYIKILLPLLFLAAALWGLQQKKYDPWFTHDQNGPRSQLSLQANSELSEYYDKAKQLAETKQENTEVSFLAAGDIMLSRNVAGTIAKANDPLLPFRNMAHVLKSTDFNFANLESPFSGKESFNPTGSLVFNAPTKNIQGLVDYNFKILNLANNHALDQGKSGVLFTTGYLDKNNIQHVGMGGSLAEAWQPAIVEARGMKICFVGASYASVNDSGKTTNEYVARIEDIENLKNALQYAKQYCDFTVATMHAGTEYNRLPNQAQIAFAHAAVDLGADMVIGTHPHWVQTIERYNDKYIFYSLGNFIFDQEWSRETKEGLTLKIHLSKTFGDALQGQKIPAKLTKIELIPIVIENYSTPRAASETEAKAILEKIGQQSAELVP